MDEIRDRTAGVSEEELEADIEEAVREVREERKIPNRLGM